MFTQATKKTPSDAANTSLPPPRSKYFSFVTPTNSNYAFTNAVSKTAIGVSSRLTGVSKFITGLIYREDDDCKAKVATGKCSDSSNPEEDEKGQAV